jgi:chemotaxis protein CheY-P-specific phosphatase CheC
MIHLGMPKDELSILHTSDDVANVLGELMNQAMGHFQTDLRNELHVTIKQNQPKMLVITKDISISIDTQIDDPLYRRVSFETEKHRPFFLELGIENTEFELLFPYEKEEEEDVEEIFMKAKRQHQEKEDSTTGMADESFIKKMGL